MKTYTPEKELKTEGIDGDFVEYIFQVCPKLKETTIPGHHYQKKDAFKLWKKNSMKRYPTLDTRVLDALFNGSVPFENSVVHAEIHSKYYTENLNNF